jgi:hypothetical protein
MNTATDLIDSFMKHRHANARYASFDYCYNYFWSFKSSSQQLSQGANLQSSCLHLMSYLGSWGMLRASSRLLRKKSMRHFVPLVALVASGSLDCLWNIDCDKYSSENIDCMIDAYNRIASLVADDDQQTLTLVTKIMMGVFGCCPAFDARATDTLRVLYGKKSGHAMRCGFRRFNQNALCCVQDCYETNRTVVDRVAQTIQTLDFDTGEATLILYPKVKVLDMILFKSKGKPFRS